MKMNSAVSLFFPGKHSIALSLLVAGSVVFLSTRSIAATFTFPSSKATINANEWKDAQRKAKVNGTIVLPNRTIGTTPFTITTRGLTIKGAKSTKLEFRGTKANSVVRVGADSVKIQSLTIQGNKAPVLNASGVLVKSGVEEAIRVNSGVKNFSISNCWITNASVGIGYATDSLPNGFRLKNVDFTTNRAMILVKVEGRNKEGLDMSSKFIIDNARLVNRSRKFQESNRGKAIRGIVFDLGNSSRLRSSPNSVNLKGSVIKNCDILPVEKWSIGLTRAHNVTIQNNVLRGGGAFGRNRFVHALHFEYKGNAGSPIVIKNNRIFQKGGPTSLSHIWLHNTQKIRSTGNTFSGFSKNGVIKQLDFTDQIR